jgi:hypothetical protein
MHQNMQRKEIKAMAGTRRKKETKQMSFLEAVGF